MFKVTLNMLRDLGVHVTYWTTHSKVELYSTNGINELEWEFILGDHHSMPEMSHWYWIEILVWSVHNSMWSMTMNLKPSNKKDTIASGN